MMGSLADLRPDLAAQWHPTRNAPLTPRDVTLGSGRRVWWQCPQGADHVWQAAVWKRVRQEHPACPFCLNLRLSTTNSLAYLRPALAAQWHPTMNEGLTAADVTVRSHRRVWWRCPNDPRHEWAARIYSRVHAGSGCPYHAGIYLLPEDSIAGRFPALVAQWHPTRNGRLRPSRISPGTTRSVWWRCPAGPDHEWRAAPVSRTRRGRGPTLTACPFCADRLASVTNSLAARRPDLAREWHESKNGRLTPHDVTCGTTRKVWWRCPAGPDHVWFAAVAPRTTRHTGCPFCGGRRPSVTNSLARLHPDVAAEWHPTKNGTLTPAAVTSGSYRKVHWRCAQDPRHEWATHVSNRTGKQHIGCPYCAHLRILPEDSLAARFPRIAAQWHRTRNGRVRSEQVASGSKRKVWWRCPRGRDHVWSARVADRTRSTGECPFCANRQVSVTNHLARLYPKVAREWHPTRNGPVRPEQVVATSGQPYWWRCPRGHAWRAPVRDRTARRRACPVCAEGLAPA